MPTSTMPPTMPPNERGKTTFASTYTKEISLAGALSLAEIAVYSKMSTGAKYLINPSKGG